MSDQEARSAAHTAPRWWTLRPEFFRTVETPSAARTIRYGFGLVKPDHTRRFLATLDRIDYDAQGHRSRGFIFDVRLFG